MPSQFLGPMSARVGGETGNLLYDSAAVFVDPIPSISLAAEDLRRILYSATALQAADEGFKGDTLLATAFGKYSEIGGVFSQSSAHCVINHIRDRTI